MATTNSTQYANTQATPRVMNATHEDRGRVRVKAFSWTQVGTGTAADQQLLAQMEAGSVRILSVSVTHSAFGASRTLDFGHLGGSDENGTAIAADPDAYSNGLDISGAGTSVIEINNLLTTKDGFVFAGQVNDGTQPAAATLTGYITYVID